jgi:PEP-CTERM motif
LGAAGVPEPTSCVMLLLGMTAFSAVSRRRIV